MELHSSTIPEEEEQREEEEAPYGYKADGTPRKRPGRRAGTTSSASRKNLDNLKEPLAERLVEYFGPPIGAISPLGLAVLDDRAEKTANGLVNLAARRPRIRKLVEGIIEGSSSLDVALTGVGIMVAIGVDVRRVDINSMPSKYFKIPDLAEETYSDTADFYSANGNGPAHHGLMNEVA